MLKMIRYLSMLSLLMFITTPAFANVSNVPIQWGFKKAKDEKPAEAGEDYDQILGKYDAFYKGDPESKDIYLTFDNGYENGYTEKFLDVLKKENVPAAFFVTGHYLESQPDIVKRMAEEGHIIGNHSYYHPDLTKVDDARVKRELEKVRAKTEEITGIKNMVYLRPPRGIFSERTLKLAKEQGYTHVMWSLAFVDWKIDQQKGWRYAYENIMDQIHPGAIILLHSVSKDNAEALQEAIRDLKDKGYTFKTLDDLTKSKSTKNPMLMND